MNIVIAIDSVTQLRLENVETFELSTMYDGQDMVLNVVGKDAAIAEAVVTAEGVARPTTTGVIASSTDQFQFLSEVYSAEALDVQRIAAGIKSTQMVPIAAGTKSVEIRTAVYDCSSLPFSVVIANAVKELTALEKAHIGEADVLETLIVPSIIGPAGSNAFYIIEHLKAPSNAPTQPEPSAAI